MHLNESYSIPNSIVKDMASYDPDLRLRYCRKSGMVRLERKVTRGAPLDPAWFKQFDDYESARDGFLKIFDFLPTQENFDKILFTLYHMDMWRTGGPLALINRLESIEAEKKENERIRRHDMFTELFKDLWRHINTVYTVPEGAGYRRYLGTGRGESLQ